MSWKTYRIAGRPWQDWLFSCAGIVFILSLVPLVLSGADIPPVTAFSTAVMLYALAVAQVSYGNWMSVATETVAASLWVVLGV